jgi:hypothetical protein
MLKELPSASHNRLIYSLFKLALWFGSMLVGVPQPATFSASAAQANVRTGICGVGGQKQTIHQVFHCFTRDQECGTCAYARGTEHISLVLGS